MRAQRWWFGVVVVAAVGCGGAKGDRDGGDSDVVGDSDRLETDVVDTQVRDTAPDTVVVDSEPAVDSDSDVVSDTDPPFDLCAWLAANPEPAASTAARIEVACPVPPEGCQFAPLILTTRARLEEAFALQAANPGEIVCETYQGTCIDFVGVGRDGVVCSVK